MLESLELYRSDRIVVRQVAGADPDRWVVTFDNYGIGHGFDRPGFGQTWLQGQGISAIHVMGRAEDWYQYEDIHVALTAVHAVVGSASRVMTYGSSMGGYAAVRFADAVGAHAALALSPQYTLDPSIAAHDRRWFQEAQRISWIKGLNGKLVTRSRVVLAYDPYGLDGWHGRRIAQDSQADLIRLPFTAHPVTSFLSEIGLLGELVMSVLDDRLYAKAFERDARERRRTSGTYLGELATLQPAHRQATAMGLARQAVRVAPTSHHARLSLARLLLRSGHKDEALSLLETLVVESDRTWPHLIHYGHALAVAGRPVEARAVAEEVMQQAGGIAHLHAWAARVRWLIGDVQAARTIIRQAVALAPANTTYLGAAADYHLGRRVSDGNRCVTPTPWSQLARWIARRVAPRRGLASPGVRRTGSESAAGS